MLSVTTLWLVFTANFLSWALMWAYLAHRYTKLSAARYWAAASLLASLAPQVALLQVLLHSPAPLVIGGLMTIGTCCLIEMGVRSFYEKPLSWRTTLVVVGVSAAALTFFRFVHDDLSMRVTFFSLGQIVPAALVLKLLLSERDVGSRTRNVGALIAAGAVSLTILTFIMRPAALLLHFGGELTLLYFNPLQEGLLLLMVFLSMTLNFGFVLMAIDGLRAEASDLALVDDLTGVANRRLLVRRLAEECALSQRTGEPFALLAIDLDGFKEINDGFGHAAGDDCLRHFTLMAQTRLRPRDMLARTGGDEFCIVLPATTLHEAAVIASRVLETCRADAQGCAGGEIAVAASIGVAQWSPLIGGDPDRLIAAADQALYAAKNDGKNRFALHDQAPPLAPEMEYGVAHVAEC